MESRSTLKKGPFLLDTGFLVALVNTADPAHAACAEAWRRVQGPFVSTEGVLVEAAWLLRRDLTAFHRLVDVILGVGTRFIPHLPWRTRRALELMEQYADVPMDLVDATLVAIASELEVRDVLTLDRRGFAAFRVGTDEKFRLLP